jgi:hypothetical protein
MKPKEIQKLVDDAVALHREIAEKSEAFKNLKARLVQQARLQPESLVPTETGGKRWTAEGSDGCVARVNFPAPGLVSELEEDSEKMPEIRALAGDSFRRLFGIVKLFQPVEHFRAKASVLLPVPKAEALIKLCENDISPRVSFETAKGIAAK